MWGKENCVLFIGFCIRITPTHVGKRIQLGTTAKQHQDHPHPCGEKLRFNFLFVGGKGSPPPMWGKGNFDSSTIFDSRITPTHVGKRH